MSSTAARMAALEDRSRARVAAIEEDKVSQSERAAGWLSPADRASLFEHLDAQEAGGAAWAEVCRTTVALEGAPLEDPAGEAARAWEEAALNTPEGIPYPRPPVGAAAYFEREAARCDTVKAEAPGEVLPDGLTLEAVLTAACWSAAWWR